MAWHRSRARRTGRAPIALHDPMRQPPADRAARDARQARRGAAGRRLLHRAAGDARLRPRRRPDLHQEAFALDTFANPFLHSISSPGLDSVMNGVTSLGSVEIVGAAVRARGGPPALAGASRRGALPGGGDRWQRGPERDHEGDLPAAAARAAVGERPARLQLPERPLDELDGLLPGHRGDPVGPLRPQGGLRSPS